MQSRGYLFSQFPLGASFYTSFRYIVCSPMPVQHNQEIKFIPVEFIDKWNPL